MGNLGEKICSQFYTYEVNKCSSSSVFLFCLFQLQKIVGDLQEDL